MPRSGNMNTKAIAVIVVVVVVAAAAAGAFVLLNSDDKKDNSYAIDGALNVYGNADGDYKIDSDDLDVIQDIIDEKKSSADYPLADADKSGKVDDADKTLVQKIIDKEPCTVNIINQKKTAGNYDSTVKWPVKSAIATGSSNNLLLFTLAGINDKIHGICYSTTPDWTLFPIYKTVERLGTSSTAIPIDAANDTIKKYSVTALISDYTDSTISNEAEYKGNGIDVIRVSAAVTDPDKYASQLLILGFLFGTETQAMEFAEWNTKVLKDIKEKVDGISKKSSAITSNSKATAKGIWISAGASDYRNVLEAAGATYAISDSYDIKAVSGYTSGAYFNTGDSWIYDIDPDFIVSMRVSSWYAGTVDIVTLWEESVGLFNMTESYQNKDVFVITGDAPITIRIAYAAAVMYPDVFSMDWANNLNKEIFEKYYPIDIDLTDKFFTISYDDYKAAKDKATA
ncbi:MAG: hypothetical protein E7Z63_05190 [Thermoplasmata archaeon]|nr:hypothetical protein [Thermoplasmata archaeon]